MKLEVAADDSLPGTVRAWVVFSSLIDRIFIEPAYEECILSHDHAPSARFRWR